MMPIGSATTSYVQRVFPLRYWLFVAYAVGVPTFISFDATGRTHEYGLFNVWSIATMLLTLTTAFLFLIVTILSREKVVARKVFFGGWMWGCLLGIFLLASIFEPQFHTQPNTRTDLYISVYRLAEWVLAFLLLLSLYSREPKEGSANLMASLLGRICWAYIAIVWLVLPIAPHLAYSVGSNDFTETHARLGGILIHPDLLATLAGIACFHTLLRLTGMMRTVAFCIAFLTNALTYSRSGEAVLLFALALYVTFYGRGVLRLLGSIAGILMLGAAALFANRIIDYLARGNGLNNITTLSDRTYVWTDAIEAIQLRPILGYGFVAGAKNALKEHWKYSHWVPPHAHNEILQALLSGGILAAILVLCLFINAIWCSLRLSRKGPVYVFFLFALIQLTLFAALVPLLTTQFGVMAAAFVISFVAVVDHKHILNRAAQTDLNDNVYEVVSATA
jgi:O-antigen ligase